MVALYDVWTRKILGLFIQPQGLYRDHISKRVKIRRADTHQLFRLGTEEDDSLGNVL